MNNLKMPVSELNRVGKTTENQLKKIGIKTIRDLLAHYPFRYEDYSQILTIEEFKTQKTGTIKVKVNLIANRRFYRKKMILTEAIVSDKTGSLQVVWFNQGFLTKTIKPGQEIYLAGKIDNANHGLQLINPSYEICASRKPIHTGGLIPIYSTTARLTQKQIRFLISQALKISSDIKDWLPLPIKNQHQLVNLDFAIKQIHFPENKKTLKQAQQRLKFNELFLLQLKNQIIREKIKKEKAPSIEFKLKETKKFVKNLPFKLTNEQRKASWEIINDLKKENRMNRLLEGDVGSGKTIVAIMSCLNVVLNNYQVAYMVPTEILAKQQFQNISNLLQKFQIKIGLLTRTNAFICNPKSQKNIKITKQNLLKKISNGEIRIIVSTHSIIGPKVRFKNLGLTIVDEQHRFGVKQRYSLTKLRNENNLSAHFLSLTATPIPRSVALTLYGDLDLSIIGKMPPGRKKIVTKIIEPEQKIDTYQFIKKEIKKGR
ncbi:DEAD/DEAH box helicase [bacterium]|nr:DEAD/DEAH box helicase [bacterium]